MFIIKIIMASSAEITINTAEEIEHYKYVAGWTTRPIPIPLLIRAIAHNERGFILSVKKNYLAAGIMHLINESMRHELHYLIDIGIDFDIVITNLGFDGHLYNIPESLIKHDNLNEVTLHLAERWLANPKYGRTDLLIYCIAHSASILLHDILELVVPIQTTQDVVQNNMMFPEQTIVIVNRKYDVCNPLNRENTTAINFAFRNGPRACMLAVLDQCNSADKEKPEHQLWINYVIQRRMQDTTYMNMLPPELAERGWI